ncbi:MAG: hypothetical protein AAF732_21690 [Pseudomonadota bacterium]
MLRPLHALFRFWEPYEDELIEFFLGNPACSNSDADDTLVLSDLCRRVTMDGVTLEITIFRSKGDRDWMLEIADGSGDATFWTEAFWSDTQALSTAMDAIKSGDLYPSAGRSGLPNAPAAVVATK